MSILNKVSDHSVGSFNNYKNDFFYQTECIKKSGEVISYKMSKEELDKYLKKYEKRK